MDVDTLNKEWDNLTLERRKEAMQALIGIYVERAAEGCDEAVNELTNMLSYAIELEADDYFGTEGARL